MGVSKNGEEIRGVSEQGLERERENDAKATERQERTTLRTILPPRGIYSTQTDSSFK